MTERRLLVTCVKNGETVYGEIHESPGLDEFVMDVFPNGSTRAEAVRYKNRRKENDYSLISAKTENGCEPRFLYAFFKLSTKLMSIKNSESDSASGFHRGRKYTMSLVNNEKADRDLYTHAVRVNLDR